MPFQQNNTWASVGGKKRAAALSAERRSEIARQGFEATTERHFNGDPQAHCQWFVQAGLAAQDASYPAYMRVWKTAMPHPAQIKQAIAETREGNGDIDFEDCRPRR